MTISPISSLSVYEYYYSINNDNKKDETGLEEELEKYGLHSSGSVTIDTIKLQEAKDNEKKEEDESTTTYDDYCKRPWAQLMYQLNISFHDDPLDDIDQIKNKLEELLVGVDDRELFDEIIDLENDLDSLYVDYEKLGISITDTGATLVSQFNSLAVAGSALG